MSRLKLISISGPDRPGITMTVTGLLGKHDVDVLDIGQSVIHDQLSLGLLISQPYDVDIDRELKASCRTLGVSAVVSAVTEQSYDEWVRLQGASRYILTLLARRIKASHIAAVTGVIAAHSLNIDNITRLSGRVPLVENDEMSKACVEFSLKGSPDESFREQLLALCADLDIDVALQEDSIFRRNRRLIAFDMDSTLIRTEVIDELAILAGVGDEVAAITEQAMRGELDFSESLARRVLLLKGLKESALEDVAKRLPLSEGVEHLFQTLNRLGYKTAVLSGGFDYFGKVLQQKLGIDYVFANRLEILEGELTGRVIPPVVDAARKADLLRELAEKEGILMQQTIAVGDGANDLAMLDAAGLGIAFHAKPLVRESAGHSISNLGLDSLLYLMGFRDRDAEVL